MRNCLVLLALILCAVVAFSEDKPLTAEEVVARHLESIGPAAVRATVKSRTAQADARMDVISGAPAIHSDGSAMLVSMGRQLSIAIRMPDGMVPNEQFVFDGKDTKIGMVAPNTRSLLGEWLYREDSLLRESTLGGTLLTSWALLDARGRGAKLKYEGLKKIDGRDLHDLSYVPKKGADNDLKIHFYFEADTFRHVKTVYTFVVAKEMQHLREQVRGTVRAMAADRSDIRYRVEETFGDFRTVDGLTLPGHWKLAYTVDGGTTIATAWDFNVGGVAHNNVTD